MGDTVYIAGLGELGLAVGDTPDLRILLVMSGFTGEAEADAVFLADITAVDEFDGIGYTAYDASSVAVTYDSASDELRIDFDDGDDIWGATVATGSDDIAGALAVVGDPTVPATCVVVGFTDQITGNANGGKLGGTFPAGWIYQAQA